MSAFGGLLLTNRGKNLQAKTQAGAPLIYTRIGIGDGQLGTTPIFDLNNLKRQVMSLAIGKLKVINSSTAVIGTMLNNSSITNGFYFREIGVFATDPDIGEILYCYGNAGVLADYIPPGGGADLIEKALDVQVLTGNATNISAVIDQSLVFETPTGAQEKADAAAKNYFDKRLVISDIQPLNQEPGGIWFQTGIGESGSNNSGDGGVMIKNAVVADDPPPDTSNFWLDS